MFSFAVFDQPFDWQLAYTDRLSKVSFSCKLYVLETMETNKFTDKI